MYFSIQVTKIFGTPEQQRKVKKLIESQATLVDSDADEHIHQEKTGLFRIRDKFKNKVIRDAFVEIRENTFAFDLLEIIETLKVKMRVTLAVYESPIESEKSVVSIGNNFDLSNYVALCLLIPKGGKNKKKSYNLNVFQDFENKKISFNLSRLFYIDPSNIKKVSEIFNEMSKVYKEVTKDYVNSNKTH